MEERAVDPAAVTPISLSPHTLAEKADTFGVPLRPIVEPVDLELEPVVAEIQNEMPLQEARGLVGHALPTEVRMDGQALEVSDPRTAVLLLEAQHTCAGAVQLDDEAAVRRRLTLRSLDLRLDPSAVAARPAGEEGLYVLVIHELEEEVEVVRTCPPDGDHRRRAHRAET